MIRDNQHIFNRLMVLIDGLIVGGSMVLAYFIKFYILSPDAGYYLELSYYYDLLPFVIPGYTPIQKVFSMIKSVFVSSPDTR